MSVALTTSVASAPSAEPTWLPNISPPTCCMTPMSGIAAARISSGSASPNDATTFAATGSTRRDQAGWVAFSQRRRLHASVPVTPDGSDVWASSQTSARRTASATAVLSALVVPASAPIACIAACSARFQLTGPLCPDIRSPSWRSMAPRSGCSPPSPPPPWLKPNGCGPPGSLTTSR